MKKWLKEGRSVPYVAVVLLAGICSIGNRLLHPNEILLYIAIGILLAVVIPLLLVRDAKSGRLSK